LAKVVVQHSTDTFVVKIATFAKSQTVRLAMHLPTKKPHTQDHILRTGFSHFKGSMRENALEARWNLALRAVEVSAVNMMNLDRFDVA